MVMSCLVLRMVTTPGVDEISPIDAPSRISLQRASGGVVLIEICWVVPSKIEAHPGAMSAAHTATDTRGSFILPPRQPGEDRRLSRSSAMTQSSHPEGLSMLEKRHLAIEQARAFAAAAGGPTRQTHQDVM